MCPPVCAMMRLLALLKGSQTVAGSDITTLVSKSPGRSLWRPSAASSLTHYWPGRTTAPLTERQTVVNSLDKNCEKNIGL